MDASEFETTLNDIETRLDRLKALYEQWFQGIERIEPQIPRKEVDRRIAMLRREQPRNTALRFRFQQLLQRYTMLATYWQRVARQIEEGTYRRDVMRLREKRIAARGRSGRPSAPPRRDSGSTDLSAVYDDEIESALSMFDDAMSISPKAPDTLPSPAPTSDRPVSVPALPRAPSIAARFARPRSSAPPAASKPTSLLAPASASPAPTPNASLPASAPKSALPVTAPSLAPKPPAVSVPAPASSLKPKAVPPPPPAASLAPRSMPAAPPNTSLKPAPNNSTAPRPIPPRPPPRMPSTGAPGQGPSLRPAPPLPKPPAKK